MRPGAVSGSPNFADRRGADHVARKDDIRTRRRGPSLRLPPTRGCRGDGGWRRTGRRVRSGCLLCVPGPRRRRRRIRLRRGIPHHRSGSCSTSCQCLVERGGQVRCDRDALALPLHADDEDVSAGLERHPVRCGAVPVVSVIVRLFFEALVTTILPRGRARCCASPRPARVSSRPQRLELPRRVQKNSGALPPPRKSSSHWASAGQCRAQLVAILTDCSPHSPRNQLLHDLVRPAVDLLHARIREHAGDRVLAPKRLVAELEDRA